MSLGRALLVALAVALTLAVQWAPRVVPGSASAEAVLRDRLLRLMASDAPLEGAVIVDIDESSIAGVAVHAEAFDQLRRLRDGHRVSPPPAGMLTALALAGMVWLAWRLGQRVRLASLL
ncbi:MAG: hypothetical protein EB131_08370, partial [Betaproteobacteria bacterium]|nr:hypothetical protein [Betaproteobacteria bacterium]